jgi:hypothetical protein
MSAVIMTEKCWANSYFSIAKYYGVVKIDGHEYKIVNKEGVTLEELSNPSSKHYVKSGKAIPPGEPADLVRKDWIPVYRKLGRDRTLELVREGVSLAEAKRIAKEGK